MTFLYGRFQKEPPMFSAKPSNYARPAGFLAFLIFLFCLPFAVSAGVPTAGNIFVTDVTTVSFSVIWSTDEACTASLEVYADVDGTTNVDGITITPHPVLSGNTDIRTAAENGGVMKVMVTGLEPATTYYFKTLSTSKSSPDTTSLPAIAPFEAVTTQSEIVRTYDDNGELKPFSNDIIIEPCYLADGSTAAVGSLLVATVAGGNYPVTGFVGDGVAAPYAIIDLNNAFSDDWNSNLDLSSGESLTLLNYRGVYGNAIVNLRVPDDGGTSEIKDGDFSLKEGWNFISMQLSPQSPSIENVLGDLQPIVKAVWTYNTDEDAWYKYLKDDPDRITDLGEMNSLKGYWVVIEDGQEGAIKVEGNFINENSISLQSGWNLVGLKSTKTRNLLDAVAPIIDNVEAVWTYETETDTWKKYLKEDPDNITDLYELIPGKAYWIVVENDVEWDLQ